MKSRITIVMVLTALTLAACSGNGGTPQPTPTPPQATPTTTVTVSPTPSPSGTSEACEAFGSTDEQSSADATELSTLVGAQMRVGEHACYERFVFEMTGSGNQPGWTVGYADPMTTDGSGEVVDLLGQADLAVTVGVWTVPDFEGRPAEWPPFTGPDDIVTSGFVAIEEARNLYAFEGVTRIGLGLDERRPFRVSWLDGPPRLAVDVYTGGIAE